MSVGNLLHKHSHTHTHTYTHACGHVCTDKHTHTHTRAQADKAAYTELYALAELRVADRMISPLPWFTFRIFTHLQSQSTHARTHAHIHTHTHTHTHQPNNKYPPTHTNAYSYTNVDEYIGTRFKLFFADFL
uniref:Uncharacterized protein n=1 Tax=Glossina morsitans morsitans TaxID=37546 RepID=A0A1B0FGN4_GLOMM